jgi:uncharacterized protein (TIGR02147 family)
MSSVGDYRKLLKETLEDRCQVNPRYSMRAFARDLKISSSRLSQILHGKQGLSEDRALEIARLLGLSTREAEIFRTQVRASDSRSKSKRRVAEIELESRQLASSPTQTLQMDAFRVISDWYHFALLELTTLPSFKSESAWIAKRLGISRHEVDQAIERLKRLELLEEKRGRLRSTETHLYTGEGVPSEAIRKFNKQILAKAVQAIDLQPLEERDITTLTVAISASDLPEYRDMIRDLRRRINQRAMEKSNKSRRGPDEVYCLGIQFFRMSEKEDSNAQ